MSMLGRVARTFALDSSLCGSDVVNVTGTILACISLTACLGAGDTAYVKRVDSPQDLIGGPNAIGDVGDFVLGNSKIKVIVQDTGWSRGFGIFGGGIIDADLERPNTKNNAAGGKDNFGELFPALFLQAFQVGDQISRDPNTGERRDLKGVEVINDGSDGKSAVIRFRASGGDFLVLLNELLDAAIPENGLRFETDYVVHPGARYVEIVGRLMNVSRATIELPNQDLQGLLGQFGITGLQMPLGDVALFGAGNKVFAPGSVSVQAGEHKSVGFDLRYSVEESYKTQPALPAFPGLVTDFLATAGKDVSYGFAAGDSERNYAWLNRAEYEKDLDATVTKHSLVVPFLVTSFAGTFYELPPTTLAPLGEEGDTFEYRRYFIIGTGDVNSIRDTLYEIRGQSTGEFFGEVVEKLSGKGEPDAWVHILDENKQPYSQLTTDDHGRFGGTLAPGTYYYRVTAAGRYPFPSLEDGTVDTDTLEKTKFAVKKGSSTFERIALPTPARITVSVRDENGRAMPAKVTLVGTYDSTYSGVDPREHLFDLSLGEEWRSTDLTFRDAVDERRFVETVVYTDAEGFASFPVRPSRLVNGAPLPYELYVSRGPEYDLYGRTQVVLREGANTAFSATLTRTVDTTDYIGVDFHVHSINSTDSFFDMESRVKSAGAEGLEVMVSTDHNVVSDFQPSIVAHNLQDWVSSFVGVELSTLEMGHFNAFPLRYANTNTTHFPFVAPCSPGKSSRSNESSFDWVECTPATMFDNLRRLDNGRVTPIVQVNHPRDTILGYFNQYYLNTHTAHPQSGQDEASVFFLYPHSRVDGQMEPQSFSYRFDAIEVFNGKRLDLLHSFKIPSTIAANDPRLATLQDTNCSSGHQDNLPGNPVVVRDGEYKYPGAVDDWLHLLNRGINYTATGNSDSHDGGEEVGYPRTYVYVERQNGERRDRHPGEISDFDVVNGVIRGRAIVTNGPFLDMTVVTASAEDPNTVIPWEMGTTVFYSANNSGRDVEFIFTLKSAPWVSVQKIWVYFNGVKQADPITIPSLRNANGSQVDDDILIRRSFRFTQDTVVVAEAESDQNMFPIVPPRQERPANISDAIGAIADGLGLDLGGQGDGITAPDILQKVTPYALTNPIWLDINANGRFDPPGNTAPIPATPKDPLVLCPERYVRPVYPAAAMFDAPKVGGRVYRKGDIRAIFHTQAVCGH